MEWLSLVDGKGVAACRQLRIGLLKLSLDRQKRNFDPGIIVESSFQLQV